MKGQTQPAKYSKSMYDSDTRETVAFAKRRDERRRRRDLAKASRRKNR